MYDIVFISYEEPNADDVYAELKERYPMAKRVHGVKGIHQAHIAAAKKCFTKMFWVVDGDAKLKDDFTFDYGWDVGGNATDGFWERAIPAGTIYSSQIANPDADVINETDAVVWKLQDLAELEGGVARAAADPHAGIKMHLANSDVAHFL